MLRASVTGLQLVASSRGTGFSINSAGIQEQRCQAGEGCASAQLCGSLPGMQVARVQAPDTRTPGCTASCLHWWPCGTTHPSAASHLPEPLKGAKVIETRAGMEGFGAYSEVADVARPAADPSTGVLQPLSWLAQLVNNFSFFFPLGQSCTVGADNITGIFPVSFASTSCFGLWLRHTRMRHELPQLLSLVCFPPGPLCTPCAGCFLLCSLLCASALSSSRGRWQGGEPGAAMCRPGCPWGLGCWQGVGGGNRVWPLLADACRVSAQHPGSLPSSFTLLCCTHADAAGLGSDCTRAGVGCALVSKGQETSSPEAEPTSVQLGWVPDSQPTQLPLPTLTRDPTYHPGALGDLLCGV